MFSLLVGNVCHEYLQCVFMKHKKIKHTCFIHKPELSNNMQFGGNYDSLMSINEIFTDSRYLRQHKMHIL